MPTVDELKDELKKASSQAVKAKMDLHDLSEELPVGWESIPEVATRAYQAYQRLAELKGAVPR